MLVEPLEGVPRPAGEVQEELGLPESLRYVLERGAEDVAFWSRFWLGVEPHPGQEEWCSSPAKEAYLVTGRRWGKSFAAALKFLWRMFHQPRTAHLNCSITMDQAKIVVERAASLALASSRFSPLVKEYLLSPFPVLRLRNGAELWARSTQRRGQFIRGRSYHSVNYDEIAFGERSDLEVLWPCLIDYAGPFSGTTTPKGQNWLFFECQRVAQEAQEEGARLELTPELRRMARYLPRGWEGRWLLDYFFKRGPSFENTFLPQEELRRMAARLPQLAFAQEIEGLFVPTEHTVFALDDVARWPLGIRDDDLELPKEQGGNERSPQADAVYVAGWDLGRKKSWAVGITLRVDCVPWRAVSRVRLHRTEWPDIADAYERETRFWRSRPLVDSTGVGDPFLGFIAPRRVPAEGFQFTGPSKQKLLEGLQQTVQERRVKIPAWTELIDQMLLYTWDQAERDQEETFDDLMAFALAVEQARLHPVAGRVIEVRGARDFSVIGRGAPHRPRFRDPKFRGW